MPLKCEILRKNFKFQKMLFTFCINNYKLLTPHWLLRGLSGATELAIVTATRRARTMRTFILILFWCVTQIKNSKTVKILPHACTLNRFLYDFFCKSWCLFWPAFGCCALQMLVKFFTLFAQKCKKEEKGKKLGKIKQKNKFSGLH